MPDKTSVEEVIRHAMQQYELECSDRKKMVRINTNPKAYVLKYAEDDGVPDEDLPALVRDQEIGQFRSKDFALVPDTSFKGNFFLILKNYPPKKKFDFC